MRLIPFVISTVVTAGLVFALNKKWGAVPPLGKFLSPQQGFWQNAEPTGKDFNADLEFKDLQGKAHVYFDERLVPHVFADNDHDLYFVQGYLHARFRLWQMEFQVFAAAGRISEHLGNDPRFVNYDRETRRSGMVFAAERSLNEIEKDPVSKQTLDAYTDGVNSYIASLSTSGLPLEYKLLNYKPEKWSNLKSALFLKLMTRTLSGSVNDLELTNEKAYIPFADFAKLYPEVPDSLEPIIPKGTVFDPPGIVPVAPLSADSLYFNKKDSAVALESIKPDADNGSNNWVVAGSRTASGAPILCNDPHLELSFPSVWYEMQLSSPDVNVYGASFPGTPSIVIGFNDHVAWGVTNSQRDVKDFYEIKFHDDSKKEFWFNGQWTKVDSIRIEVIKVAGAATVYDTVAYTFMGPVMYDKSFSTAMTNNRAIVCHWEGHEASNEGMSFYKLNRATNYNDYLEAIKTFKCPGQNFVFASKSNEIAIWQQGKFPARWKGQGLMVMPGSDSSYLWQGFIPPGENPHAKDPARGFLVSANQRAVDSTYPYYIPGNYITPRGISIIHKLQNMQQITVDNMKQLQTDYFNVTAEDARPLLLKYVRQNELDGDAKKYLDIFRQWDLNADPNSTGQTIFDAWWSNVASGVWSDELSKFPNAIIPNLQTLLEALLKDSTFSYIDNINTTQKETLDDIVTSALERAAPALAMEEKAGTLSWTKHKSPHVFHLLKTLLPFAKAIPVGGNGDIINATTISHGPSWRMIVQLTENTEAYGVYPGGQDGNPGSRFYDNFVDTWAQGQYYTLWMMKRSETGDKRVKWTMNFTNNNAK
jgi:penicillin amidase